MNPLDSTFSILRRSRGLSLVFLAFMIVYFVSGFRAKEAPTTTDHWVIGFAFLLAVSGIVMTFLELRSDSMSAETLDVAGSASDLQHVLEQLARNYDVQRRQATQGFVLAGTFMALGICVILAGSIGDMFGLTKEGANLTTVAGIVVEVISGAGLYLFRETFARLNTTSDRLHQAWRLMLAFKHTENLPAEKKADMLVELIRKLASDADEKKANQSLQPTRPSAPRG